MKIRLKSKQIFLIIQCAKYFSLCILLHWLACIFLINVSNDIVLYYFLVVIGVMILSFILYLNNLRKLNNDKDKGNIFFRRDKPFAIFGNIYFHFSYNFFSRNEIDSFHNVINDSIKNNLLFHNIKEMNFTDKDPKLTRSDGRLFVMGQVTSLIRDDTTLTLITHMNRIGNMYTFSWWILCSGGLDKLNFLKFILFSPFTFIFWIIPYLRGNMDIAEKTHSDPYNAFYNYLDIQVHIDSINKLIVLNLVEELNNLGIDTSDLIQKVNNISFNISGGKNKFRNISNIVSNFKF